MENPPRSSELASARRVLHRDESGVEFSRVVAFSDGVFSIAITLLVLSIEIPQHVSDLSHLLVQQEGDFLAYVLSFAVLGKLWLAHHRFFSAVERFDGTLMGLNILYLGCVALVPVTTNLLGDYGDQTVAVIVYALNLAAVSLSFSVSIVYAYRRGLMKPEMRQFEHRFAGPANFLVAGVFLLSVPVAVVSPAAAIVMWLAVFFVGRRLGDLVVRRALE
jgi:uncharacterized membrane protein